MKATRLFLSYYLLFYAFFGAGTACSSIETPSIEAEEATWPTDQADCETSLQTATDSVESALATEQPNPYSTKPFSPPNSLDNKIFTEKGVPAIGGQPKASPRLLRDPSEVDFPQTRAQMDAGPKPKLLDKKKFGSSSLASPFATKPQGNSTLNTFFQQEFTRISDEILDTLVQKQPYSSEQLPAAIKLALKPIVKENKALSFDAASGDLSLETGLGQKTLGIINIVAAIKNSLSLGADGHFIIQKISSEEFNGMILIMKKPSSLGKKWGL